MIKKTKRWKVQREIRRWANKHSEEVYEALGRICNNQKCRATDDLTIHHKEYKKGIEYLEILCNRCHKKFHKQETAKRLLIYAMEEIEEFQNLHDTDSIVKLKEWLNDKINKIPVDIIPDLQMDGFPK